MDSSLYGPVSQGKGRINRPWKKFSKGGGKQRFTAIYRPKEDGVQVQQQQRVMEILGTNSEDEVFSPRMEQYVDNLLPLLDMFNYTRSDIKDLVQNCKFDETAINESVAKILEDSAPVASKDWSTVLSKKDKKTQMEKKKLKIELQKQAKELQEKQRQLEEKENKRREEERKEEERRRREEEERKGVEEEKRQEEAKKRAEVKKKLKRRIANRAATECKYARTGALGVLFRSYALSEHTSCTTSSVLCECFGALTTLQLVCFLSSLKGSFFLIF